MKNFLFLFLFISQLGLSQSTVKIGAKKFTEGNILAHIISQNLKELGHSNVEVLENLGGTGILAKSIETNEISLYVDYTGTLYQIYKTDRKNLKTILSKNNIILGEQLGFNNSYGLAVKSDSKFKNISEISESSFTLGISHEFSKRDDGLDALLKEYTLTPRDTIKMEHSLLYSALLNNEVDVIEVYTTDAKLKKYDLKLLTDDRLFFPDYSAVLLGNKTFVEKNLKLWEKLNLVLSKSTLTQKMMVNLNHKVEVEKYSYKAAAESFLGIEISKKEDVLIPSIIEHLVYVIVTVTLCIIIGIPIGVFINRSKRFGSFAMGTISALQTIPSIALLVFLIPFFGLGNITVIVALVLYGLLPIVKATVTGFKSIPSELIEYANFIQMSSFQKLRLVEIPMAKKSLFSGIRLCSVYSIGVSVIAAFVGAGGLGTLIVTGLSLNDQEMILKGAIPSALMAVILNKVLEVIEQRYFS